MQRVFTQDCLCRCLEGLALGRSSADDALLPDGLFVDETITALHVDDRKIRVGGSGGTLLSVEHSLCSLEILNTDQT